MASILCTIHYRRQAREVWQRIRWTNAAPGQARRSGDTSMTDHIQREDEPQTLDRLEDIFQRQGALAEYYRQTRPDGFYSWPSLDRCTTWTRSIVHECCELDNELNWKPWKNGKALDANREERLMETADILHFLVQLALDQGFTAEELHRAYVAKNEENRERQRSDPRYAPGAER